MEKSRNKLNAIVLIVHLSLEVIQMPCRLLFYPNAQETFITTFCMTFKMLCQTVLL